VHRRLTQTETEDLVAAYQDGSTLRSLARAFGIHRETVGHLLDRAGIDRQDRHVTAERLKVATQRYAQGDSLAAIAQALNVNAETVRKALIGAGISMRPRRGWRY
jgi:transposase-like protein